jgi:hypothetical protein
MDANYVYNIAKAATGAMLHFAVASTTLSENTPITNQVSFYPNPAKGSISITMGSLNESTYTFSLIDLNGKKVLEKTIENPQLIETVNLDVLTKGMYLAVFQTAKERLTRKILIE